MKETCSEILIEAELLGGLQLQHVAFDAIAGISAIAGQQLAKMGLVTEANGALSVARFAQAASAGFISGAKIGWRLREIKRDAKP